MGRASCASPKSTPYWRGNMMPPLMDKKVRPQGALRVGTQETGA